MSLMLFVLAFQASAVPVTAPAVAPVAKPKMICEEVEEMGSRLNNKRICMTRDQWLQRRRDDADDTSRRQTGQQIDKPSGN